MNLYLRFPKATKTDIIRGFLDTWGPLRMREQAGYMFYNYEADVIAQTIPTLIYGIVMYTLNYLRVVDGPYPFLKVHDQPWYMSVVWFLVLLGLAYGVAVLLRKLCGRKS